MAPKSNNTIHISFGNFTSRLKILDKYLQKPYMNIIYIYIYIYPDIDIQQIEKTKKSVHV